MREMSLGDRTTLRLGLCAAGALAAIVVGACAATGQNESISAWDAAEFRSWSFVPYWTSQSQLNTFPSDNVYDHVSDVLYFSGVRPTANGGLYNPSSAQQHLATLRSHAAQEGFNLQMSMFDVPPGNDVDTVWNSIVASPTYRANFVNNVKNLLQTYDMKGFNFDWERPSTDAEWAGYTQLAKDLRAAIEPLGMEISVDDYGFADSDWDDTTVFDARTYDQLFIMGYHYPAYSADSLNNNTFANTKLNLTGQGAAKAFKNEQLVLGIGTWGANGPATVSFKNIAAANPNLPPDANSFTGTVRDINGVSRTGTWEIESRYEVRDKVQLALDRNMAGMMFWTLHYDATNKLSLHRVAHHYAVVRRNVPDLNLDGKVNQVDANTLADHMGSVPGWTGTNTPARFDDFYMSGNWEAGDRDGNGFVNQQDADWLAARFATLGLNLPDRLAYSGTFERLDDSIGLAGRWRAIRNSAGQLPETGNFVQHGAGYLTFDANGPGADKHSHTTVTLRNQNAAEAYDSLNLAPRQMEADLAAPIDLAQDDEVYFTFLVRQNTGSLLGSQIASPDRTLALEFLDGAGANQFDFSFHGLQQEFRINSQEDDGGEDVATTGFSANSTFLFVGKIAGHGAAPNTLQASLFASGSTIGNFTRGDFPWMLSAESSAGFDPTLARLRWSSLFEGSFTVSDLQLGPASTFFTPTATELGDFNEDGVVDGADYTLWRDTLEQTIVPGSGADGDGDGIIDHDDYALWKNNFGAITTSSASAAGTTNAEVPEPTSLLLVAFLGVLVATGRKAKR